jgi:hypothetical protein
MWTSVSLLLLLIYVIYRRRQNKLDEEQDQEGQGFVEQTRSREPSEYRLSAVRALPTIVEENATTLSPSNSNHNFTPLVTSTNNTTSLIILGKTKSVCCQTNINYYFR